MSRSGETDVAVKMMKAGASEAEKVRFLQEAAINGQFHHPNVVTLLGVVTVGEPVSAASKNNVFEQVKAISTVVVVYRHVSKYRIALIFRESKII